MGKKRWASEMMSWLVLILLVAAAPYAKYSWPESPIPYTRGYVLGWLYLCIFIISRAWIIRRQYKKAHKMDRDCCILLAITILLTILCVALLLI